MPGPLQLLSPPFHMTSNTKQMRPNGKGTTELGGKVVHGPRKNPLDFGGNPDHVTFALRLELRLT